MQKAKIGDEIFFPFKNQQIKHIVLEVKEDEKGVYYFVNSLYSMYKDGSDNNWIQSPMWDTKEKWYHSQYEEWHEGKCKIN